MDDEMFAGGFAVGHNTWQESLAWSDKHGKDWLYGLEQFSKMKPEELAMLVNAAHYVVDSLEEKKRDKDESRLYEFCLDFIVSFW